MEFTKFNHKKNTMKKIFLLVLLFFGLEMIACDYDVGSIDQVEMNQMIIGSNVGILNVQFVMNEPGFINDQQKMINQQINVGNVIRAKYKTQKILSLFYTYEIDKSNRLNGSAGGLIYRRDNRNENQL